MFSYLIYSNDGLIFSPFSQFGNGTVFETIDVLTLNNFPWTTQINRGAASNVDITNSDVYVFVVWTVQDVSEPSSFLLVVLGMFGLLLGHIKSELITHDN